MSKSDFKHDADWVISSTEKSKQTFMNEMGLTFNTHVK